MIFSEPENAVITIHSRCAGERPVRAMKLSAGATVLAAAAIGGLGMAPAHADINNPAINGTFLATSNGEWAKSQDTYHDEPSIKSVGPFPTPGETPVLSRGPGNTPRGGTA